MMTMTTTTTASPITKPMLADTCERLPTCRSEWGYERQGGELYSGQDVKWEVTQVATPQECCQICAKEPKCGAYKCVGWAQWAGVGWGGWEAARRAFLRPPEAAAAAAAAEAKAWAWLRA